MDVVTGAMQFSRGALRIAEMPLDRQPTMQEAFDALEPQYREAHVQRVQAAIEQGTPWDTEFGMVTPSGRKVVGAISGSRSYRKRKDRQALRVRCTISPTGAKKNSLSKKKKKKKATSNSGALSRLPKRASGQ